MADSNNAARVNWLLADGGGVARLPNTIAVHGTGWTILGLDDGTLQAAGTGRDAPVAGNYLSGLKTFFVGSGGGTVDTDGKDVALPQTIACDATPAFTKAGAGTLTLGQTLKWPGDVDVQAGVLSAALTSGVACAALPTNLLARYSSEGGPGIDSSGNTRHGIAWGSALTAVTAPFGGSALNFPAGSIIAMPMDAVMRGMGTYTVSMWVKAGSVSGTGGTFFTTRMGNSNDAYQFMLRINSGKFRYMATGATDNGWASNAFDSTSNVPVNVWFHCAAVVTGGTSVTLYLNGQLEKAVTGKSGLLFCPTTRPLGGLGFGIGHPYLTIAPSGEFTGQLDDVQIYNRALSGAEVAALAAAPSPVVPTLRVANGASAALQGATVVRTLSGEGYVAGGPLTVLESASPGDAADTPAGAALLTDALVLSDGITYRCDWSGSLSDALHTGALTIGGAATLDLGREEGQVLNDSYRVVLATYDTIAGAENLATWSIINAGGNGYEAAIIAEDGEVVLTYRSTRGTLMLFK
jgi:autotransporter-associated beta strand protein